MPVRFPLTITHPEIAAEWDYNKNGNLTPDNVSKGQQIKVYWLCKHGHSFLTRIDHRCSMHSGCPYCSGKLPIIGETDLATTYPEISAEWDYAKNEASPESFLPFSSKSVYWLCPICGKSYMRKIVDRTYNAFGCKNCMGERHTSRQEQIIYYYLQKVTSVENRIKIGGNEIDVYLPELNVGIEYNGEYYHKNKKTSDARKAQQIIASGVRLITISCGRSRQLHNDHIILETPENANPRDEEFTWGLSQLFTMLNLPQPEIALRRDMVDIYSLYIKSIKDNSVAEKFPNIAQEWDYERNNGLSPYSFSYGTSKIVWWKCPVCQLSYDMQISNRTIGKQSCPYCSGKRVSAGYNDLATTNPELLNEWDYDSNSISPQEISKGSSYKARWKCTVCGFMWDAVVFSRTRGNGCPVCANQMIIPGYNDLLTMKPELKSLWNYTRNIKKPSEYFAGSQKKAWWICDTCGHEWQAVIASVASGCRCPECAKQNRIVNRKQTFLIKSGSFALEYPQLLEEWDWEQNIDISPYCITPGSREKVWWKCRKCNHTWLAIVYARKRGSGCPECGRRNSVNGRIADYIRKSGSLADNHPELLSEWDYEKNQPLSPDTVTSGSNKKAWWICKKCGYHWKSVIRTRSNGCGCPACAGKKVTK